MSEKEARNWKAAAYDRMMQATTLIRETGGMGPVEVTCGTCKALFLFQDLTDSSKIYDMPPTLPKFCPNCGHPKAHKK